MKRNPNYSRKVFNTKKFANALLSGEIKLAYEVIGGKRIAIYIPKNLEVKK